MAHRFRIGLATLALFLPAATQAAEGEMVIPASQLSAEHVTMEGNRKVLVYGPVAVTPRIKTTKGTIFVYLEGVTFGGHAGSVELYLVFPPHGLTKRKGLRMDNGDYVGGTGAMEDDHPEPTTRTLEINDFEVQGVPFRPRTHLQNASEVMLALVSPTPNFKFERVVITTESSTERAIKVAPAAPAAIACDMQLFHQWETGKWVEHCQSQKSCLLEPHRDLNCAGKPDPASCLNRCVASGLEAIARAYKMDPPDEKACIACIARGYARYIEKCGKRCPACPDDAAGWKRCEQCMKADDMYSGCLN